MNPQSHEIQAQTFPIALKFDWHLGSSAAEMSVNFQSDTIIITSNPMASRDFMRFGGKTSYRLVNRGTGTLTCNQVSATHMKIKHSLAVT